MSRRFVFEKLLLASELPATAKCVGLTIATHMGPTGEAWPSIPTIAKEASVSERSVYRSIAALKKSGLLTVTGTWGTSNRYQAVTLPLSHPPLPHGQSTPDRVSPKQPRTSKEHGVPRFNASERPPMPLSEVMERW